MKRPLKARLIAPATIAAFMVTSACSRGPYCYEWNDARGDATEKAAAHQEWILARLPDDVLKLIRDEQGAINRSRLEDLDRLLFVNCELHLTLPVATTLRDIIDSYHAGNFKLFKN